LRSESDDPAATIVKGVWDPNTNGPAAVRCVYLAAGASLIGFTLTNGATATGTTGAADGGGVYCADKTAIVSNCVIVGNAAHRHGGGVFHGTIHDSVIANNRAANVSYIGAGGAYESILFDSTIRDNFSSGYAAGAYNSPLTRCAIVGNSGASGVVYLSTLTDCLVSNNFCTSYGSVHGCTATNCVIVGNRAKSGGGVCGGSLYNSTVVGNFATDCGGGFREATLYNCTVVGNAAAVRGGGAWGKSVVYNSIVYYNSPDNLYTGWGSSYYPTLTNSCCYPRISTWKEGDGNIIANPMFVSWGSGYGTNHVAGDCHLQKMSPCIDAGTNMAWITAATLDLDGRPRIRNGTVDMGVYEFVPASRGTLFLAQ
jgi:hypothetical protein